MLNWCKNYRPDHTTEIYIPPSPLIRPSSTHHSLHLQRNAKPTEKTIRKIKPHPRKNSCTNGQQTLKFDKGVQVSHGINTSNMVDSATQTPRSATETTQHTLLMGSLLPSREESQLKLWDKSSYMSGDFLKKSEQVQSVRSRKQSDLKIDTNFRTKATHCMVETKDKVEMCEKSRLWG